MVLCAPVFTVFRCGGAGCRRGGCARSGCSAGFGGRSGGCRAGVRGEAYAKDRHPAVSGSAGPGSGGAGLVSGGIGGVSGGIGRDVWADGDGRGLSEDTGQLALSGGIWRDVRIGGGCRAQGRASAGGTKKPPRRREALGSEAAEAAARAVISRGGWSPCRGR